MKFLSVVTQPSIYQNILPFFILFFLFLKIPDTNQMLHFSYQGNASSKIAFSALPSFFLSLRKWHAPPVLSVFLSRSALAPCDLVKVCGSVNLLR